MVVNKLTLHALKRIAIYGGVVALGGAVFFTYKIQANFRQQEYYKLSMELLRGYPPANKLLGEPIRARRVELGSPEKTRTDSLCAKLTISVKGRKHNGILHSWSSRSNVNEHWTVDKLDLEVDNRRWTFYVSPHSDETVSKDDPSPTTESTAVVQSSPAGEDLNLLTLTDRSPNELLYINVPSRS